ncbi:acyl carrier protein [Saccharothrix syringae]|uniref:acyl carrier protein n=1 Tax=Saccharothrix syringae TaxID=103733 RepID=UPI000689244D|nr:acyl carrier protein [Saccharothrix syringae]
MTDPDLVTGTPAPVAPDPVVASVRRIWADVLDAEQVPVDAGFFEIGGDSLLFIVLLERLSRFCGRELDAAELFEHGTVADQARFLTSGEGGRDAAGQDAGGRGAAAIGAHDRSRLLGRSRRA